MFRIFMAIALLIVGKGVLAQSDVAFEIGNVTFNQDNTQMTINVNIFTTAGSDFTLGGSNTSNWTEVVLNYSNSPNDVQNLQAGEMIFHSATGPSLYRMETTDNGTGQLTLKVRGLAGSNFTVSSTKTTLFQVTFDLGPNTTGLHTTNIETDPNNTVVKQKATNTTQNIDDNSFIDISGQALPITLQAFNILLSKDVILLNWTTASEENNEGFELQRSYDGLIFEPIGWVDGNGNSLSPIDYSFIDREASIGKTKTIYYRIRQVDFDGVFNYTLTRSINLDGSSSITWFPNPARENIIVNTNEIAIIEVYDMAGKTVLTSNTLESNSVDVSRIEMGTYLMIIKNMNGEVISQDKLHIK
ncbi:MAG: T9SS type A sorting domain-containing protein [Bacteroidia bacterium]